MSKYTAGIDHITRLNGDRNSPIVAVTVSVYGDLPSRKVAPRTRNVILREAHRAVRIYGMSPQDLKDIRYRVAVNNGEERHEVVFERTHWS